MRNLAKINISKPNIIDMNSKQTNKLQEIGSVEPTIHPKFTSLLNKYLKLVEEHKNAFVAYNKIHSDQNTLEIFSTYWKLEASSSSIESERVTLKRKDQYTNLPGELKVLIY